MNKWVIIYRVISINVFLFIINVVDSADTDPTTTTDLSTTEQTNVDSSQPTTTTTATESHEETTTTSNEESSEPTDTDSVTTPTETPPNTSPPDSSQFTTTTDSKSPEQTETTSNEESSEPTDTDSGTTPSETPTNTSTTDPSQPTTSTDGKLSLDKVKLYGKTSDNSSPEELQPDKYQTENKHYPEYDFKQVKLTEFKYDDKTVWKHLENKNKDKYPSTMKVVTSRSLVSLYFVGFYCYYEFDGNDWKLKDYLSKDKCYDPDVKNAVSNLSAVTVNFTKTSGNSDYDYKAEGNKRTFTAKDGKVFNTVKDGLTKVWDTKDRNLYVKSAVYEGVGTQNLSLTLNHFNNSYTTFTKQDGNWKQHSTGTYETEESTEESDENKSQLESTKSESDESTLETTESEMTEE